MSLRIERSTFGLCTPQRAVCDNKFVIPKILIENLIDDEFSVKELYFYPIFYVCQKEQFLDVC